MDRQHPCENRNVARSAAFEEQLDNISSAGVARGPECGGCYCVAILIPHAIPRKMGIDVRASIEEHCDQCERCLLAGRPAAAGSHQRELPQAATIRIGAVL
eukprot:scaffold75163_cov65-Phaeocystis_antarctica.AAC.2